MYSEWASLSAVIAENNCGQSRSVLDKFPVGGRDVAVAVVSKGLLSGSIVSLYSTHRVFQTKQLASSLGISQPAEPSALTTESEVNWCMDVICYGLSLPLLSDHETIKDCVNVYCEWLTALHPVPKISVPAPIRADPNLYARKIIHHLHNLFVPRPGEGEWALDGLICVQGVSQSRSLCLACFNLRRCL